MGDSINALTGQAIASVCPRHVCAARLHDDTFALLVPDASQRTCQTLAEQARVAIAALRFQDEVTGDTISVSASLGYANYPQSLRGVQFQRTPREQARILLRAAAKAVGVAKDQGRDRVFNYSDIVKTGGRVLETPAASGREPGPLRGRTGGPALPGLVAPAGARPRRPPGRGRGPA